MEIVAAIPFWARIYWGVLIIFYAAGNYYERKEERRKIWVILLDTISVSFISLFLIDFFNNRTESLIGLWIVPMTVTGIIWELYIAEKEVCKHEQNPDPDLSERANIICNYIGLTIVNLIIVPGYFLGLWLCFYELKKVV